MVLGGTIPGHDIAALKAQGVAEVFGPGTPLETTVSFIRTHVKPREIPQFYSLFARFVIMNVTFTTGRAAPQMDCKGRCKVMRRLPYSCDYI